MRSRRRACAAGVAAASRRGEVGIAGPPAGRGKYLVCNGDEGDPGAYMDRSVLEGNPHGVLEGMIIGACATGGRTGYAYIRNEYPLAMERSRGAISRPRRAVCWGEHSRARLRFDLRMVRGAGAFVCGEETALIHSIEGAGEPRPAALPGSGRSLGPAHGDQQRQDLGPRTRHHGTGARDGMRGSGGPASAGSAVFSLGGQIDKTGLVEVPMGMPLRRPRRRTSAAAVGRAKNQGRADRRPVRRLLPSQNSRSARSITSH